MQNIPGPEEEKKTPKDTFDLLLPSGSSPETLVCQEMSLSKFICSLFSVKAFVTGSLCQTVGFF